MSATLPDVNVKTIDQPPVLAIPTDSTRLIVAAESFRGTREPTPFASPMDLGRYLERSGAGIAAWDYVDVAQREGVPEVWLARLLGPAAANAPVALAGAGGTSLTIKAHEPGEWANGAAGGLTAEVINGPGGAGERVVIVRRASTGAEVGRTTAATNRADLITAVGLIAQTVRRGVTIPTLEVTAGADLGLPNVVAPTNFAGGLSDSAGITTVQLRAALDLVDVNLGAMTVVAPGRNTDASNLELMSYAGATDRIALLEQAPGLAVGTITASAATLRAGTTRGAEGTSRLAGLWPQRLTGPGVTPGSTRTIPATITVAGLIARLEHAEGHPNVAPFADQGFPRWATGISETYTAADAVTLFNAGANVFTGFLGTPRNRSFRSLEPDGQSEWVDLAHSRTDRVVRAMARTIGRQMGARVINADTVASFGSRLREALVPLWRRGALFGATAADAFRVDTDSVNDATTMAARAVNAAVGLRMSEHGEFVNITIAKVPIGQEV